MYSLLIHDMFTTAATCTCTWECARTHISPTSVYPQHVHLTANTSHLQVHDNSIAPRHPGDHTPRLLVERLRPSHGGGGGGVGGGGGGGGGCSVGGGVGGGGSGGDDSDFVTGRLLLSPWSAFKGAILIP